MVEMFNKIGGMFPFGQRANHLSVSTRTTMFCPDCHGGHGGCATCKFTGKVPYLETMQCFSCRKFLSLDQYSTKKGQLMARCNSCLDELRLKARSYIMEKPNEDTPNE